MMRRMKYHGKIFPPVAERGAVTFTSCERQTQKPGTTVGHFAVRQAPAVSVVVEEQERHCESVPPEHVAQPLEQLLQTPEGASKYWEEEQVRMQVELVDLTGRDDGHDLQVSNVPLHVAQSG